MWWAPLVPLGFFADRGSRWRWLAMPGVVILTALTSSVGKLAIRRPRPGSTYRVVPWGRLSPAGFPSTHSACAFAIAGWLRASRYGRWLHGLAVLIGCSRVRCRAHHSVDVAAGAILGYGIAWQIDKTWSRLRADPTLRPAAPALPPPVAPREERGGRSHPQVRRVAHRGGVGEADRPHSLRRHRLAQRPDRHRNPLAVAAAEQLLEVGDAELS